MGADEDDWETADLTQPEPQSKAKSKSKPKPAPSDPRNLRPSAPSFSPRPAGDPGPSAAGPSLWGPASTTNGLRVDTPKRETGTGTGPAPVILARPPRSTSGSASARQDDEDDPWTRSAPAVPTNRQIWQAANTPQPYIPPVASPTGPLAPTPGLRILRRPSPSSAPASGSSTPVAPRGKTLEEREAEYRRARERIFAQDQAHAQAQGLAGSGSSRERPADGQGEADKRSGASGSGGGAGSASGSQRGRERDKAQTQRDPAQPQPRDEIDDVIRAAEEMALAPAPGSAAPQAVPPRADSASISASTSSSSSSRGRGRGRGKPRQIPLEDDFETRTDMAMRSAPLDPVMAGYAYGYAPAVAPGAGPFSTNANVNANITSHGYGPSRSSSGTASPVHPANGNTAPYLSAGLFDPFGSGTTWDADSAPLRPAGEAGIVRQPRGPAEGGGTGFGAAVRSRPSGGA